MIKKSFFSNRAAWAFISTIAGYCAILGICGCLSKVASQGADTCPSLKKLSYDISLLKGLKNIVPVLVLGSGPAGLSAALYTARENILTAVMHGDQPGGLLTDTTYVENWPGEISILGPDLIAKMQSQVSKFNVLFLNDTATRVDMSTWPFIVTTKGGITIHALTIIACTGSTPKTLGIDGEEEYAKKGSVSSCAICDAWRFKNKSVVIVGGGDSAVEEATQLATHVKDVVILVRKERMRAAQSMQERLAGYPNVSIRYSAEPIRIMGDGNDVTGVEVLNIGTGKHETVPASGVFLAIGHTPNSQLFKDAIPLSSAGHILVEGRSQKTSLGGIFAAGDVTEPIYRQGGIASGDGIKAALDALEFLRHIGFDALQIAKSKNDLLTQPGRHDAVGKDTSAPIVPKVIDDRSKQPEKAEKNDPVKVISSMSDLKTLIGNNTDRPIVIDCFTTECGSCRRLLPIFQDVAANDFSDRLVFAKVNLDLVPELGAKFLVTHVPTILALGKSEDTDNEQLVTLAKYVGFIEKTDLIEFLSALVS